MCDLAYARNWAMLGAAMDYVPIGIPFYLAFWFLFALVVAMIEIGVLQFVFQSMGVSRRYMFALLIFTLLGSYVNIPVARLASEPMRTGQIVDYFGVQYV